MLHSTPDLTLSNSSNASLNSAFRSWSRDSAAIAAAVVSVLWFGGKETRRGAWLLVVTFVECIFKSRALHHLVEKIIS